jgi:hypothetical protein
MHAVIHATLQEKKRYCAVMFIPGKRISFAPNSTAHQGCIFAIHFDAFLKKYYSDSTIR